MKAFKTNLISADWPEYKKSVSSFVVPQEILAASDSYNKDNDDIYSFIAESLKRTDNDNDRFNLKVLYKSYRVSTPYNAKKLGDFITHIKKNLSLPVEKNCLIGFVMDSVSN